MADALENRCRRYEDGLLKIEICRTLQHIIADRSKDILLQLTTDFDFDVRKSAILALASFTPYKKPLTPILLQFLQDEHWSVREAVVTTIGLLHIEGVEEQLLQICRALVSEPRLLLLDEPTAGMGESESRSVQQMIKKFKEKSVTTMVVAHDMRLIMDISDRIIVLNFGTEIASGTLKQIQNNPEVVDAYLGI